MSSISNPYIYSPGTLIQSAQVDASFSTIYNDYNGNVTDFNVSNAALLNPAKLSGIPGRADIRISSTSGVAIPTADIATVNTIYGVPFNGGQIALNDGSGNFILRSFTTQISLALSGLTTNNAYSLYVYWTGSAIAFDTPVVWTSGTVPDSQQTIAGVILKGTDVTRRFVGAFYATGATSTSDTSAGGQRYISNIQNLVPRLVQCVDTTTNWTTTSVTAVAANGNTSNGVGRVSIFQAGQLYPIEVDSYNFAGNNTGGNLVYNGFGFDSTTMPIAATAYQAYTANAFGQCNVRLAISPQIGFHYLQRLNWVNGGTGTFNGNTSFTNSGLLVALGYF